MALRQQAIFVSVFPPSPFPLPPPWLPIPPLPPIPYHFPPQGVPSSSSLHLLLIPKESSTDSYTLVSAYCLAKKILSLCTFQENDQPKKFRKKNSLSLIDFYQLRPGGTRVPRKSKLINALPRGVEEGGEGGQPNQAIISF